VDRPCGGDKNVKKSVNGGRLNNRGRFHRNKYRVANNNHGTPIELCNRQDYITMKLLTKNPFSRDNIGTSGTRNKLPGVVLK
jgi:hypothetical protein